MADFVTNPQIPQHTVTSIAVGQRIGVWVFMGLIGLSVSTFGQSKQAQKFFAQASEKIAERRNSEAIELLQQAIRADPNYLDAHARLGQLFESARQPQPAMAAYREVIRLQPNGAQALAAQQAIGAINLRLGHYAEAVSYLEKVEPHIPPTSPMMARLHRQLANARFGKTAVEQPQPVQPRPLSEALTTTVSQYFPVLTADEQTLVFTALKPEGDEDLMISTYGKEGWLPPRSLSSAINTRNNEGTATLSADGRTLVFTACQGRESLGGCDLYVSMRTGDDWSVPDNLGEGINSRYYESQPSLSADGRRLYFVSDRPGGLGLRDIWQSDKQPDGNWTKPINLGLPVNTPFNEASPFIHANGQSLFFASEGHTGMGGYDLFVATTAKTSTETGLGWQEPINLGFPINNADDQASLFVAAGGKHAYYSYEEQVGGNSRQSRIYTFDWPESLRQQVRPVSYLKGTITDARSKKTMPAAIELIDLQSRKTVSRVTADAQTGHYTTVLPSGGEYALYVSREGYLFKSLSFDFTAQTEGEGLTKDVALEPAVAGSDAHETLNNLFFDTGRYDLADKSRTELDKLVDFLKQNPNVRLEVAGHTDDVGDAKANLTLSQKRAQSVIEYLAKAGIEPQRLKAVGFGETRPVAPNTTDENRQQNRRIEWRVL